MIVLQMLQAVLSAAWDTFFLAAPFVLFGLLLAGLLHVLVSRRQLVRWMGGGGLAGAARAALLGIPLPLCSCGIVPVAISLRRQGASRPAVLSFLITTPESSADAVVLTWGLMGPLMAVARLVAALASAMVAAVMAIAAGATGEHDPHAGHEGPHNGHEDPHADHAGGDAVLVMHARHTGFMAREKAGQLIRRHQEINRGNDEQDDAEQSENELHDSTCRSGRCWEQRGEI